ncbi:MAG: SDR family oxidoreductase [Pseudomonadales bacterium]
MSTKVLIAGGSGFLAVNWALAICEHSEVGLLTHNHPVNLPSITATKLGLEDTGPLLAWVNAWRPTVIVNAAGMTNVDQCELNPENAYIANVVVASNLAKAAKHVSAKLVHISTDHLFNGRQAMLDVDAEPQPLNEYARSKLAGETAVLEVNPDAIVVRTNFYGWGTPLRESISDWVIGSLRAGKPITAFDDEFFTTIFIKHLVAVANSLVTHGANGILHISGNERISKFDFALALAEAFDLDGSLIKRAKVEKADFKAPRPLDMSLDNSRAKEIVGDIFGSISEGFQMLQEQEQADRPKSLSQALCG